MEADGRLRVARTRRCPSVRSRTLDSPGGSGSVRGDRAPDIRDLPEDLP